MPTKRGVRVVLLVEDEALERFVRCVLLAFGFRTRDIRVERSPKGQGSGKDWVTRNYPAEVRVHRSKAGYQQNIALVVGVDADEQTVVERVRKLDLALEGAGLGKREPVEKLCLMIPRWHIETWLLYLSGFEVDEETTYKNDPRIKNVDYAPVADEFVRRYRNWKQGNLIETTLLAMITAFEEMKRLDL